MVTLDIENVFNTAKWDLVVADMMNKEVSIYTVEIVKSYFEDVEYG